VDSLRPRQTINGPVTSSLQGTESPLRIRIQMRFPALPFLRSRSHLRRGHTPIERSSVCAVTWHT
jgi:hypothetical protein